jgi:hypothetical protein
MMLCRPLSAVLHGPRTPFADGDAQWHTCQRCAVMAGHSRETKLGSTECVCLGVKSPLRGTGDLCPCAGIVASIFFVCVSHQTLPLFSLVLARKVSQLPLVRAVQSIIFHSIKAVSETQK